MRSLIHCKGGYDMKVARFIKEYAGCINGMSKGTENPDYYGARIRKTIANYERGLLGLAETMRELSRVLDDITEEKTGDCLSYFMTN